MIFRAAGGEFLHKTPLEITKEVDFFGRRRRFLARNPFRNPQNSEIFRPPEAAELGSQISSSEKEGGQPEGGDTRSEMY